MRRALTVVALLALMGGFAFGVNRFLAARQHHVPTVTAPTATKPAFSLPGTMIVAQEGQLYRLQNGTFTALHLPNLGTWMQPSPVPGTSNYVVVARTAAYSDIYLIDRNGSILSQLSHNATASKTIQLNHWMFWPHVSGDGKTLWESYDSPKSQQSYEIDFAIWSGSLTGQIAQQQWTTPFGYTGGDVQPVPLPDGALLYSKYQIHGGSVFSQLALQTAAQATPAYLTTATDDCSQPAVSPQGTMVAMICIGSTGFQSSRLEVAPLVGTKLGTPYVLVNNCLCSAPSWSPDGTGLVYFNPPDLNGQFEMWWIAGAGTGAPKPARQVTTGLDFDATSPPAWSQ